MLPPDEAPISVMLLAFVVVKTGKVGLFSDSSLEQESSARLAKSKSIFFSFINYISHRPKCKLIIKISVGHLPNSFKRSYQEPEQQSKAKPTP